jgi:hypothetical protein
MEALFYTIAMVILADLIKVKIDWIANSDDDDEQSSSLSNTT